MRKLTNVHAAKEFVREHIDLFRVISEDIGDEYEWNEDGTTTYITLSPFREETKPSFKVSGKRFKDWGGDQYSGDVFSWIQLWHGLSFYESITYLADRFNLDIVEFLRDPTPEEIQLSIYKRANKIAAEWMHQSLRENDSIRDDYLSRSGFNLDMIEPYLVGYCPSKDALVVHVAQNIKISDDDIDRLELNRFDLFNDAIVYPIHNYSSEIIGFYTKQLNVDDAPYKSTRKGHPLHDPGVLYGFHAIKKNFRKTGPKITAVEGFRDTIALTAVGCMGSTITQPQIDTLKNHNIRTINFCFDGDYSGWTNTLDLINRPDDFGDILVLVSRPEVDKDPHDIWLEGGDEAVQQMLNNTKIPIEYYVNSSYDVDNLSVTNRHKLLHDIKDYLTKATGIHLDIGAHYLAGILGSSKESVIDYVAELKAQYSELFNLEAERVVIGHCMKLSASYSTFRSAGITEKAFTLSPYRKLFQACTICYDKYGTDYTPQVVLDEAMAKFVDPELPNIVPRILEETYKYKDSAACEIVLDMWRRRIASDQASGLINASRDLSKSFVEVVDDHRKTLVSTISSSRPQARTPKELAAEVFQIVKERSLAGGNLIIGADLHCLPSVSLVLGGAQKGHMITIAGDTGAGKSLLAMNFAKCIAVDKKIPLLWIGQEMSSHENTMRLASIIAKISNTKIQTGNLSKQEAQKFADALKIIENSAFYMAKPRDGTADEILAIVDEYRFKYSIEYVVWDYIQLVQQAEKQNRMSREGVIGAASKMVKNRIAEDMGIGVFVIAQLNRDQIAKGKHKIGGSFQISQDTDDFLEVMEKTKQQIAEDGISNGNRYVKIGKRRGGMSLFQVNAFLDVDPRSTTLNITECSTPSEITQLYQKLAA